MRHHLRFLILIQGFDRIRAVHRDRSRRWWAVDLSLADVRAFAATVDRVTDTAIPVGM